MRDTFARTLTSIAERDERVVLLSGDIGNRMFDEYKLVAPERFINCGIAEANMMSVAAGLALRGLKPVVYTITPFITTRCLEQIKIGAAYHDAGVVIVGTGSGLSYAELGATHHSFEDIAVLNVMPGLQILTPGDKAEAEVHLNEAISSECPTYIRLGKKGEPDLRRINSNMGIGKGDFIQNGHDIAIIASGPIISEALAAAGLYEEATSCRVGVVNIGSIKPLDNQLMNRLASDYKQLITLEEHSTIGGLGTIVREWLAENGMSNVKVKKMGIADSFIHQLGKQAYIRGELGINAAGILNTLLELTGEKE